MERKTSMNVLTWVALAALISQSSFISADNFEDQKNFFPIPHAGLTPPIVSYGSPPSHSSGGVPVIPTPSHGSSSGGSPRVNCGGTTPSGCSHHSTPSPTKGSSSGGYYQSPPTKVPTAPTTPTPIIVTPPTILTPPLSPYPFDPHSPPFTCNYWRTHPGLIWGLFSWWGTTVGSAFGSSSSSPPSSSNIPGLGSGTNLLQALSNTRMDGFGSLYREGTAALLNSMANAKSFPYTTNQVEDSFAAALGSTNGAAANQAQLFKLANEGKITKMN